MIIIIWYDLIKCSTCPPGRTRATKVDSCIAKGLHQDAWQVAIINKMPGNWQSKIIMITHTVTRVCTGMTKQHWFWWWWLPTEWQWFWWTNYDVYWVILTGWQGLSGGQISYQEDLSAYCHRETCKKWNVIREKTFTFSKTYSRIRFFWSLKSLCGRQLMLFLFKSLKIWCYRNVCFGGWSLMEAKKSKNALARLKSCYLGAQCPLDVTESYMASIRWWWWWRWKTQGLTSSGDQEDRQAMIEEETEVGCRKESWF